ncbi:MAG: hypothetical protein JXA00_03010 [Candidatus Thermoplasmatota archaeon]|nr:hypothetical protein [Candidatus Thermoplasmatota archaeon]
MGLLVISGFGAIAAPASEQTSMSTVVGFSQPVVREDGAFVALQMTGTNAVSMEQGCPMLPYYVESFSFPFGTRITDVTVQLSGSQTQTLSTPVAPTPPMMMLGLQAVPETKTVMYGPEPYPSEWFTYAVGGGRDQAGQLSVLVTVEVHPVRYHPAEKLVESYQEASIVISYEPAGPQSAPRDTYELVVIAPSEYSSQVAPLITHKTSQGLTAKSVSLPDIYNGVYFPATGRDNQEKIKYFIKNAIEDWSTTYVLLMGGSSKVPVRETHVFIDDDPYYGDEVFTTDLYYADIYNATGGFSSWDTNNNNIFGEYHWNGQTDVVDLHPDVYLGRLAATSTSQVTSSVNKIIGYENTPGYQQSWFPNLVVVGGDSFEDTNDIDEGEYSNQKVIDVMTGFLPDKQWVTNGKLTGYVPTGVASIKNAISAGCGFVDFSGHGNTNIWATHPHANHNTWVPTPAGGFRTSDVTTLSNGNKLPIVTVEACSTAKFASDPNCFNWAFVYLSSGGAIGSFGCTGIGYGYGGTAVVNSLIGKMGLDTYKAYKLDESTALGEMWGKALNRYIKVNMNDADHKTVEEWQLFGDPSLAIGEESEPPAKPATPAGPVSGKVGTEYTYTSSTTDPEGDQVSYLFDWGDNTTSGWVGPLASGATVSAKKTWTAKGSYGVKVVAKDSHGKLSVWSDPLPITMPTSFEMQHPLLQLLQMIWERFPNAFPLLRVLLQ